MIKKIILFFIPLLLLIISSFFIKPTLASISVSVTLKDFDKDKKTATVTWSVPEADKAQITHFKIFLKQGETVTYVSSPDKDIASSSLTNIVEGTTVVVHAYKDDTPTGDLGSGQTTAIENFSPIGTTFEPTQGSNVSNDANDPTKAITELVARIISYLLGFAGILAVFAVAYSGYMYVSSLGNEEKVEKAKKNLTWSIIGTLIIVFLYAIVQFVAKIITTSP